MSEPEQTRESGPMAIAVAAGVLCANSLPHLAAAAAGRRMLTPLAGRQSPPAVNALWGAANLAAGLLIIGRRGRRGAPERADLGAFGVGVALFSVWAVAGEAIFGFNAHEDSSDDGGAET